MELQEGLRQGCVLSPILYCAFINCFMLEQPSKPVPGAEEGIFEEFLSQGIQGMQGAPGAGINVPALGRRLLTLLFMDDTTLVAKTEHGLRHLIKAHMNFCSKFRMRLNPTKSKMLRFTKDKGANTSFSLVVDGKEFSTPAPCKGTGVVTHKLLGFHMDTNLSGDTHTKRAIGKGNGMAKGLRKISKVMGERMGHHRLETAVTPATLFGTELVPDRADKRRSVSAKLHSSYRKAVSRASLLSTDDEWAEGLRNVHLGGLEWDSAQLPWEYERGRRAINLAGKLRRSAQAGAGPRQNLSAGLAGALCKGKKEQHLPDRFLSATAAQATGWAVTTSAVRPPRGGALARWKTRLWRELHNAKRLAGFKDLAARAADPAQGGEQSNRAYLAGINADQYAQDAHWKGLAGEWQDWVPQQSHRLQMRRVLTGGVPGLKSSLRWASGWKDLPRTAQEEFLACGCGRGPQGAWHVVTTCQRTEFFRDRSAAILQDTVNAIADGRDKTKMAATRPGKLRSHVWSSWHRWSDPVEKIARSAAAKLWYEEGRPVLAAMAAENAGLALDVQMAAL